MPQAKQVPHQSRKSQSIVIEELTTTTLRFALPEAGLLPARNGRPLMICPQDDLTEVIPLDETHETLLNLCRKLRPGSGKIDYLRITAKMKKTYVEVQLQAEHDSQGIRTRVEGAIREAGY